MVNIEKSQERKIYESKLNFFTNVAHEFFTPLTLIYTPAQYLSEKKDLGNEVKKYIDVIKDNAGRMQKLIHELIEFRKDKSNYEPLCPKTIVIKDCIESITRNYDKILKDNRVDFQVNIHDTFIFLGLQRIGKNCI